MSFLFSSFAQTTWCGFNVSVPENSLSETDRKIRSFSGLRPGWHYGKGGSASQEIIKIAAEYNRLFFMLGFRETAAFPGADGEIMVSAYHGTHCVDVTIEIDKTFTVAHQFDKQDQYYESGLSGLKACEALRGIATKISEQEECATSSLFIQRTMIGAAHASQTWLSRHPATGVELLSFLNNVELLRAEQFAPTSIGSTKALAEIPQFFGDLKTRKSLYHAT
jgi:hypothetical protein